MAGEADVEHPCVEIRAEVKAQSVRFGDVPEVETEFCGDSTAVSARENLPDEVEPGVTYRDVHVRWAVRAGLDPHFLKP